MDSGSDITFATSNTNWCEIEVERLAENARFFKSLVGSYTILAVAVKANAYGHGLRIAADAFVRGGADWLCVHSLEEAECLRTHGISVPIHLVGPVPLNRLRRVSELSLSMVVYTLETVEELITLNAPVRLHLKVETGNHRQGVGLTMALRLAKKIAAAPLLELEGVCTHFSDIEDTTDHRFARQQMTTFESIVTALNEAGHPIPIRHVANTAATLLWADLPYEMVRVGIGAYGLWPSKETQIAALIAGRTAPNFVQGVTWKTWVAQVKDVPEGAYIGYGRTYRTTHPSRIAVLPVGYFDGYDRKISNRGFVLCNGKRAPVVGRVCMNMVMVDVTHIEGVSLGDEVVLMGTQGDEAVSAEDIAGWTGTINYEVVSRIGTHVPRIEVSGSVQSEAGAAPYRLPKADSNPS